MSAGDCDQCLLLTRFGDRKDEAGAAEMNGAQLRLLLQGLEIKSRRGWYRRGPRLEASRLAHSRAKPPNFGIEIAGNVRRLRP
jgi:hypothetical protein